MPNTKRKRSNSTYSTSNKRRWRRNSIRRSMKLKRYVPIVHRFKRSYEALNIGLGTAGNTFGAFEFKLSQISNVSEFTALFDSYTITCVVCRVYYGMTVIEGNSSAQQLGYFHYYKDFNDAISPSSIQDMREVSTYRCVPANRLQGKKIVIRPRVAEMVYRTSVTTGYAMGRKNIFIDCNATGIECPFFGLKYCFEAPATSVNHYLRIVNTMYFKCKTVK